MTVRDHRRTHVATIARQALTVALVVGWCALAVVAFLARDHEVDAEQLREDLRSGDVDLALVVGERRSPGVSEVVVRWQHGLGTRSTRLTQVRGEGGTPSVDDPATVRGSVVDELQRLDPTLHVDTLDRLPDESSGVRLLGGRVPDGWQPVAVVVALLTIGLLVAGPDPEVATRWAWFWLMSLPVLGVLAYLLLGGLWRRHPTPGPQRLTGGTAFVASVLLGLLVSVVLS